jgi:hypothetical protein
LGDQETPLGSSTLVKDPKVKTTQRQYKPMRCMAFRVRGKESGVSWMRIKQARRGELGK